MSEQNRDRLQSMKSQIVVPQPQTVDLVMPSLEPQIAMQALKGFIPFSEDRAKQTRYKLFLESYAGIRSPGEIKFVPVTKKDGKMQTMEELNKELEDFAKSARVFKPMSSGIASRFTSEVKKSDVKVRQVGLYQPTFEDKEKKEEAKGKEKDDERVTINDNDPPHVKAVKLGMFGPLTRKIENFYPEKLLCKRFGVENPWPDGKPKDEEVNKSRMDELLEKSGFKPIEKVTEAEEEGEEGGGYLLGKDNDNNEENKIVLPTLETVGLGEDETQGRDTLTYKKPEMDIFKAIFAEDEDSDDEDDTKVKQEEIVDSGNTLAQSSVVEQTSVTQMVEDDTKPVDLANFRPTFQSKVIKREREGDERVTNDTTPNKKKKKEKKSKKATGLSFDVDNEGEEEDSGPKLNKNENKKRIEKNAQGEEHRKKKRRKEDAPVNGEEGEMEWVEKVDSAPVTSNQPKSQTESNEANKPTIVTRMRAADFLDD
jgi:G patch domain-containing protein 1